MQVSELIERFADGSADREAPVHALKKALQLVATDCHASYARYGVPVVMRMSTYQAPALVNGAATDGSAVQGQQQE